MASEFYSNPLQRCPYYQKTLKQFKSSPNVWVLLAYTEKPQVLLKITSSKKDQHFTKDLILILHEDSESEIVPHGKSKVWLKYYTITFQIAYKTKKENLKPWSNDASVVPT